jgi:hypothetical protein
MQATAISARKVDFSRASRQPLATASAWMRACRPTPPTLPDWTEAVAQTPEGRTGSVLRVGSKNPKVIARPRRALLGLGAPSAFHGRHSECRTGSRRRLCATASTMSGCNGRYAGRCRNGARSDAGGQVTERTRRTQPPEYHRRTELFSGVLRAPSARRSPDQRRSENPRTRLPGGLRFGTRFEAGWRRPSNRSLSAMASVNLRSCRHGQAGGARFVACWILGVRFAGHRRSSGP